MLLLLPLLLILLLLPITTTSNQDYISFLTEIYISTRSSWSFVVTVNNKPKFTALAFSSTSVLHGLTQYSHGETGGGWGGEEDIARPHSPLRRDIWFVYNIMLLFIVPIFPFSLPGRYFATTVLQQTIFKVIDMVIPIKKKITAKWRLKLVYLHCLVVISIIN